MRVTELDLYNFDFMPEDLDTLFLFRRRIFKKRYKDKPVVEWKDDSE